MKTLLIGLDKGRIDGMYPKSGTKTYYRANRSENVALTVEDNTIVASMYERHKENTENKLFVRDGYILGINDGEFGGGIYFVPNGVDVPTNIDILDLLYKVLLSDCYQRILRENFQGFIVYGKRKFVLTGLAYLCSDNGELHELVCENDKWTAKLLLDIGSCPCIYTQVGNKVYIAAANLVELMFGIEVTMRVLVEEKLWGGLYPNSIICANDSLYIGMRGFVYVYNLKTGGETWYNYLSYDKKINDGEFIKNLPD